MTPIYYIFVIMKETGYKIGFGGKYWTLWNVWSEKVKNYKGEPTEELHFDYIQNLSLDLDKAKEKFVKKTGITEIIVDENLKGQSFIQREEKEWIDYEYDEFHLGKYRGSKFIDVVKTDPDYLKWFLQHKTTNNISYIIKAFESVNTIMFVFHWVKKINTDFGFFETDILFFDTEEEKENYLKNYTNRFYYTDEDLYYEDKEKN